MKTTGTLVNSVAILAILSFWSTGVFSQKCDSEDPAFAEPPPGVDAIVVTVEGGRPYVKALASIDSTGRALLVRDAGHPENTRRAMLSSSLFYRLISEAYSAAEADRMRQENHQSDTTTLEGLLEAVRQVAVGCDAHLDGVDRHVTTYVAGQQTRHECVGVDLSKLNHYIFEVVADATDETGEFLCP